MRSVFAQRAVVVCLGVGFALCGVRLPVSSAQPLPSSSNTRQAPAETAAGEVPPFVLENDSATIPLDKLGVGLPSDTTKVVDILNEDGESYSRAAATLASMKLCFVGKISSDHILVQTCRAEPAAQSRSWNTFLEDLGKKVQERAALADSQELIGRWAPELERTGEALYILSGSDRIIPTTVRQVSLFLLEGKELKAGFPISLGASCALSRLAQGVALRDVCNDAPLPLPPIAASLKGGVLSIVRLSHQKSTRHASVEIEGVAAQDSTVSRRKVPVIIKPAPDSGSTPTKLSPSESLAVASAQQGGQTESGSGAHSKAAKSVSIRSAGTLSQKGLATTMSAPPPPTSPVNDSFTELFKDRTPLKPEARAIVLERLREGILEYSKSTGTD